MRSSGPYPFAMDDNKKRIAWQEGLLVAGYYGEAYCPKCDANKSVVLKKLSSPTISPQIQTDNESRPACSACGEATMYGPAAVSECGYCHNDKLIPEVVEVKKPSRQSLDKEVPLKERPSHAESFLLVLWWPLGLIPLGLGIGSVIGSLSANLNWLSIVLGLSTVPLLVLGWKVLRKRKVIPALIMGVAAIVAAGLSLWF